MTSLSYEDIFSNFLGYITDYDFAHLNDDDAYTLMSEYLQKAISKTYIRRLFSSVNMDNEIQEINFEVSHPTEESEDLFFIQTILAKGMVVEWLEPQVKKTSLIHQHITSSKESKFYSQAMHLSEIRSLLEDTKIEIRKLIRDRGYIYNSYLGNA